MNILISGSNGFVGSFLLKKFLQVNHQIVTIGKSENNNFSLDLRKSSAAIKGHFNLIIHCASIVHNNIHASTENQNLIQDDISISENFIKSISECTYDKFIYLSSVAVYGIEMGQNVKEINPLPKNGYGIGKLAVEKLLEKKVNTEKLLVLRLPLVNGPNPKGNIQKLVERLEKGRVILFKDNPALKSIIELEDLYSFIDNYGLAINGTFNIKSYDILFNDFVKLYAYKMNAKILLAPLGILKILIFLTFYLNSKHYNTLKKIRNTLTFSDHKLKSHLDDYTKLLQN